MRGCPSDRVASGWQIKGNNTLESQRSYNVGRMDMLFSLVDAGNLTLDTAADFIGMEWEDATDMLQGWKEAQQM